MSARVFAGLAVSATALAMAVTSNEARADDERQKELQASHETAVTLDALRLLDRMIELSAEQSLPYDFSVAASAGIGVESQRQWAVGAQGRYYAVGDFNHGMPIVCEALYVSDNRDYKNERELILSLMIGYKLALRSGFTVGVAAGAGVPVVSSIPRSENTLIGLMVDSGIGWSF